MTSRRKVPFSFHCTICYEALNLTDRSPVVLPCGHTFLCSSCAKKLSRCMECRTPLVASTQPVAAATMFEPQSQSRSSALCQARYGPHKSPVPTRRIEEVPLPTPKNLVLMSLMEAAENIQAASTPNDDGYESGDDDELVVGSMRVLGDACGTYVVRERAGLDVFGLESRVEDESSEDTAEEEEEIVRETSFRLSLRRLKKSARRQSRRQVLRSGTRSPPPPSKPFLMRLAFGQTVQVVAIQNNTAKLARGRGYVRFQDPSQLVRVGNATDEACRLEGILHSVNMQKREMKQRIQMLNKVEGDLAHDLSKALRFKEGERVEEKPDDRRATPEPDETVPGAVEVSPMSSPASPEPDCRPISFSKNTAATTSPPAPEHILKAAVNGINIIPSAKTREGVDPSFCEAMDSVHTLVCADFLPLLFCEEEEEDYSSAREVRDSDTVRTDNGSVSGSVVDFRTGLSGHRALTSSSSLANRPLTPEPREIRMMSEHTGLGGSFLCAKSGDC